MRRRALLAGIASGSAALAGCSLPSSIGAAGDGTDVDPAVYLEFAEDVGEPTRTRCLRCLEGTVEIVDAKPDEPIRVEHEPFRTREVGMPSSVAFVERLVPGRILPAEDVRVPGALGTYNSERRRLTLADPETLPDSMYADTDLFPELSFEDFPFDGHVAHELAHAIQNDVAPDPPFPDDVDGRIADRAISEGTADYVQGRYRQQCIAGDRECTPREFQLRPEIVPLWLVLRRFPYRTGAAFVHAAHERGGWERVWALNRDPPASTWAIMFPEQHLDGDVAIERLDSPPELEGWQQPVIRYPGAVGLYFLLRALDVAQVDDPETAVEPAMTEATGVERIYRTDRLSGWRGGGLSIYSRSADGPYAVRWATTWASAADAAAQAEAIASAYDDAASPNGDGWRVGEGHVALEQSDETLRIYAGPTADAVAEIRGA